MPESIQAVSRKTRGWQQRPCRNYATASAVVAREGPRQYKLARMTAPAANYPLLDSIKFPEDLRRLPPAKLPLLAEELRQFLIQSVSTRGGHFAAGLGTVELTVALHYIFNTPYDRLVWDVGHQAYPHQVLTGRRDQLHTIKQAGGLAPFPARSESEYDTFGANVCAPARGRQKGLASDAHRVGTGTPLGRASEGHGAARHAVRGNGLQLH